MRRGAFAALKYVHQRKRPAGLIAKRGEEQVNVIGHDHQSMEMNARSEGHAFAGEGARATLAKPMFQNYIAGLHGQDHSGSSAGGYKESGVGFLQWGSLRRYLYLARMTELEDMGVNLLPLALSVLSPVSVTSEQSGSELMGQSFRGRGRPRHTGRVVASIDEGQSERSDWP